MAPVKCPSFQRVNLVPLLTVRSSILGSTLVSVYLCVRLCVRYDSVMTVAAFLNPQRRSPRRTMQSPSEWCFPARIFFLSEVLDSRVKRKVTFQVLLCAYPPSFMSETACHDADHKKQENGAWGLFSLLPGDQTKNISRIVCGLRKGDMFSERNIQKNWGAITKRKQFLQNVHLFWKTAGTWSVVWASSKCSLKLGMWTYVRPLWQLESCLCFVFIILLWHLFHTRWSLHNSSRGLRSHVLSLLCQENWGRWLFPFGIAITLFQMDWRLFLLVTVQPLRKNIGTLFADEFCLNDAVTMSSCDSNKTLQSNWPREWSPYLDAVVKAVTEDQISSRFRNVPTFGMSFSGLARFLLDHETCYFYQILTPQEFLIHGTLSQVVHMCLHVYCICMCIFTLYG